LITAIDNAHKQPLFSKLMLDWRKPGNYVTSWNRYDTWTIRNCYAKKSNTWFVHQLRIQYTSLNTTVNTSL